MREEISQELFERAKKKIPGGVNSPVRAFQSVGMIPEIYPFGKGRQDYGCGWQ